MTERIRHQIEENVAVTCIEEVIYRERCKTGRGMVNKDHQ